VARQYFDLPSTVEVHNMDARAYLNQDGPGYDLIFLDSFTGENVPWYLDTKEGLARMKARLNPGGRLIINSVTRLNGSPGLDRIEAGVSEVFGEGEVFIDNGHGTGTDLVNACLVAGKGLKMNDGVGYPGQALPLIAERALALTRVGRPIQHLVPATGDDYSDLDYAEAELRNEWRRLVLGQIGPEVLGD
jgi:hypothetical protein